MKGVKGADAKELLSAALRQMVAARGTDTVTGDLLQRVAKKYAQRALDVLLVERSGVQAAPVA